MLCNHHHHPSPELLLLPALKLWTYSTPDPHYPPPQSLAPPILLSVPINLATLSTLYKWNHTVFALLQQAYFLYHFINTRLFYLLLILFGKNLKCWQHFWLTELYYNWKILLNCKCITKIRNVMFKLKISTNYNIGLNCSFCHFSL